MTGTLPGLLAHRAAESPDGVALREKEFGIWQETTWARYFARVRAFSLGLHELGVGTGDRIALIGGNRPEWPVAELAAQAAGVVPVGLYPDAVADEVAAILETADPVAVIAEDQEQVDKLREVRDRLPAVRHIIYDDPRGLRAYQTPGLRAFTEVEAIGAARDKHDPSAFDERLDAVDPGDTALLCTTSGTTSLPKLAMLSHANLLATAQQLQQADPMHPGDNYVSSLPLAWIGEQSFAVFCALWVGFTINFPEDAETVRRDLREIGPHFMFSPPRIWENMVSQVQVMAAGSTPLKRRVYRWAAKAGHRAADARLAGRELTSRERLGCRIADWTVFAPIRDQLGLARLRRAYTGGAALGPDVFRFFHAMGVNLKQVYGQTEVSGLSVIHADGQVRFDTVGTPLPSTEVKVSEGGEVLCRGPAVFQGYFKNPEATAQAMEDGWLRSGDAGYFDEGGQLVVIDRLDDVMRLPGGQTFSPQFVENKLKFSPYIGEAVVFGGVDFDFVSAMIAIDLENTGQWAEQRGIPYTTFTDLARREAVRDLVRDHVCHVNRDLPQAARIRRFLLLHKELHADDAELTRTRKVRRRHIHARFRKVVDALAGSADAVTIETKISYQDGRNVAVTHDLRIETLG